MYIAIQVHRIHLSSGDNSGPLPLRSEIGDLPGFSKIAFLFTSVSVGRDGSVSIEWPDFKDRENLSPSVCLLQDEPFDQGTTKKVYKVLFALHLLIWFLRATGNLQRVPMGCETLL